jgi:lipid-binding SYLF domain-containing protein
MTPICQIRIAAIALLLGSTAIVPAFAQGSSIQSQPLGPAAKNPAPAAPAPATGGYVTGDQPGTEAPQPLDGSAPAQAAPAVAAAPEIPNKTSDQQNLLNRADVTMKYLRGNKDYAEVDQYLAKAKGVFIVPQLVKAAFFIGGEGGTGVMLARLPDNTWSAPSFTAIGGLSFGLQAGAKSSEIVFLIMTDKGLDAILNRDVKLGADISVALVTVGKGLSASTGMDTNADIYAVAKADGLYGGAALDGSVIHALDDDNAAYYGRPIDARDILNGRVPPPPGAQPLVEDLR